MPVNKDFYMLAGSSGQSTGYTIDQSIRFNDGDSAYMHRTPSGAGDRRTFTYSLWFKLGDMATTQRMFLSVRNSDTTRDNIMFNQASAGDYRIYFDARVSGSAHTVLEPTRALRDPSAWYHLVVTVDTTNAVSTERVKIYLNGERETVFTNETYPSLNQQFQINNTDKHSIGRFEFSSPSGYWDGYFAEMHLLDGYAYGPEFFGEFDDFNNWIPKEYSGSYGTNGFKIDGRDSSDLGDDESGNGNDFTTSGLASHDQVSDTPTNNWSVMNPLNGDGGTTWKNGNLELSTANQGNNASTIFMTTGKWYWEVKGQGYAGAVCSVDRGQFNSGITPSNSDSIGYYSTGDFYWGGGSDSTPASYASSDIIGIAVNMDDGNISFYKNNTLQGTLSFSSTVSSLATDGCYACVNNGTSSSSITFYVNFGQDGTFSGTNSTR